ncbi:MAG TPA: CHC2 zinc finger domain-containing protein [Chloroflexota bacterium]|nr:CHC2 zinc finger domain-containing protein [Chloroflexota bacterium]
MSLDKVLSVLEAPRRSGSSWKALCPAHQDRNASLSVCERDGRVLIHCHAGCATKDVLDALGLGWDSLFSGDGDD